MSTYYCKIWEYVRNWAGVGGSAIRKEQWLYGKKKSVMALFYLTPPCLCYVKVSADRVYSSRCAIVDSFIVMTYAWN